MLEAKEGSERRTKQIRRKPTKATNEDEVSEADRKLHQRIADEVKRKLQDKGESTEGVENFEAFYGMIRDEALKLQQEYQPQLRNGIKIAVDLVNQVQKDKQDGDVDVLITIAPNNNKDEHSIPFNKAKSENLDEGIDNLSALQTKLGLSDTKWTKFLDDFKNSPDILKKFDANPLLVKGWEVLVTTTRKSDFKWIEQMSKWLKLGVKYKLIDDAIHFKAPNGFIFAKIKEDKLYYNYDGFGGDILVSPNKVTTVLGKFHDPPKFGTSVYLDKTKTGLIDGLISRVVNKCPPNNSIAFLDLPTDQYNSLLNSDIKNNILSNPLFKENKSKLDLIDDLDPWGEEIKNIIINKLLPNASENEALSILKKGIDNGNETFWKRYNLPFLEEAFKRGDDIRLVSDPKEYQMDPVKGGSYKRELDAITASDGLASKYSYSYNKSTKTYTKK